MSTTNSSRKITITDIKIIKNDKKYGQIKNESNKNINEYKNISPVVILNKTIIADAAVSAVSAVTTTTATSLSLSGDDKNVLKQQQYTTPKQLTDIAKETIFTGEYSSAASETVNRINRNTRSSSTTTTTTTEAPLNSTKIRRSHKIKDFNDIISCFLCRGYLIDAVTVDYCLHSFCQSCIVKYLEKEKRCPACRPGGKQISLSNLRPDKQLTSLVYKIVPGLYQNEYHRQVQFYSGHDTNGDVSDETQIPEPNDNFFSPVEPISMSLEYHPQSLHGCDKQMIPPIRYLQCPAAVTVHHLKKFICSKYDIDPNNQRVSIEIIYDDEILPENYSLMDVGYCFNWKRLAPMRFFYRILIYDNFNEANTINNSINATSDKNINNDKEETEDLEKIDEATSNKLNKTKSELYEKENALSLSIAHDEISSIIDKDSSIKTSLEKDQMILMPPPPVPPPPVPPPLSPSSSSLESRTVKPLKYSIFKTKSLKSEKRKQKQYNDYLGSFHNNNNNIEHCETKINKMSKLLKSDKNDEKNNKRSVKVTIARKANELRVKHNKHENGNNSGKSKYKINKILMPPTPSVTAITNDFKNLRSNDVRYMNNYNAATTDTSLLTNKQENKTSISIENKLNNEKDVTPSIVIEPPKPVTKSDIVVSIPQAHIQNISSEDNLQNLSLSLLKTANKKTIVNANPTKTVENSLNLTESLEISDSNCNEKNEHFKMRSKQNETEMMNQSKPNVPKLKIELPSLKTKIKIPKKSSNSEHELKKDLKSKKLSQKDINEPSEPTSINDQVDLTTYAKNIGLKPVNRSLHNVEKMTNNQDNKTLRGFSENSPISVIPSLHSSKSNNEEKNSNTEQISSSSSLHRKRKKAKHSKESKESNGSSKRRKLHAEIASKPNSNESLKLKVKITSTNHKLSHKTEKKANIYESEDDDVIITSPPPLTKISSYTTSTIQTSTQNQTSSKNQVTSTSSVTESQQTVNAINFSSNLTNCKPQTQNVNTYSFGNDKSQLKYSNTKLNNKTNDLMSNINEVITLDDSNPAISNEKSATPNILPTSFTSSIITPSSPTTTANTTVKTTNFEEVISSSSQIIKSNAENTNNSQNNLNDIPVSPPLPPSLFKTSSMSLNSLTPSPTKIQNNNPNHSKVTSTNDARNIAISQLNRLTAKTSSSKSRFAIPNSPPPLSSPTKNAWLSSTPKLSPINKQTVSLKRSASLDESPVLIKMKKSPHTPYLAPSLSSSKSYKNMTNSVSPMGNVRRADTTHNSSQLQLRKNIPPPLLLSPLASAKTKMPETVSSLSSCMMNSSGVTITPQKQTPPFPLYQQHKPALEILRIASNPSPNDQRTSGNHAMKLTSSKTTRPPPATIPLVKIKRANYQIPPLKLSLTKTNNNNVMQQQAQKFRQNKSTTSKILNVPYNKGQNDSLSSRVSTKQTTNNKIIVSNNHVCDDIGALDLSGKSSRSPSQEISSPVGSPHHTKPQKSSVENNMKSSIPVNSIEEAVNKIKNIISEKSTTSALMTTTTTTTAATNTSTTSNTMPSKISTANLSNSQISEEQKLSEAASNLALMTSHALQSLKIQSSFLSESISNRNKLMIKNQKSEIPILPKPNEINKIRNNATVRQQNPSIRNIPNPSALAFRDHQSLPPILTNLTKSTSTTTTVSSNLTTVTSPITSTPQKPSLSPTSTMNPLLTMTNSETSDTKTLSKPEKNIAQQPIVAKLENSSPNNHTSAKLAVNETTEEVLKQQISPVTMTSTKKIVNIDKLAETLRAAVAAENLLNSTSLKLQNETTTPTATIINSPKATVAAVATTTQATTTAISLTNALPSSSSPSSTTEAVTSKENFSKTTTTLSTTLMSPTTTDTSSIATAATTITATTATVTTKSLDEKNTEKEIIKNISTTSSAAVEITNSSQSSTKELTTTATITNPCILATSIAISASSV